MNPLFRRPVAGLIVLLVLGFGGTAGQADILRTGAAKANASRNAAARERAGTEAAALAQQVHQDRLARTTQALTAMKNLQSAARAAALRGPDNLGINPNDPTQMLPDVTNGLGPNGLEVDVTNPRWDGADVPVQYQSGEQTVVNIRQTAQQAVLHWSKFNVGKKTTVNFDQRAGGSDAAKWVAFNRITDPTGQPSQILGNINAQGQVYLINQNGIIFGGTSQVNARGLVAASLPINENLIERGLLNNPDAQFLFSGLTMPAGAQGTPAFTPPTAPPSGRYGDVVVRAGARLTSPMDAQKTGGRIMLVGANVRNEGTISTPNGQTILAAGLQVGFEAHSSSDPSLRGLDVYVGLVEDPLSGLARYAGTVTNTGLIEIARANLTMAGADVRQMGAVAGTTSVSLNGRIDLLANYNAVQNTTYDPTRPDVSKPFFFQNTGSVTLGPGSMMRILPELWSSEKAVGTELALRSMLNIAGKAVHFGAGSMFMAGNGRIEVKAGKWNYIASTTAPRSDFVFTEGQIYVDRGVLLDVSGTPGVSLPISGNILSLELRGNELAPSPLQRGGVLRGVPLFVDLRQRGIYKNREWVGTPLGDATGFLNLIERGVGELTLQGGSVDLRAGSSVVIQKGAQLDVSGGYINYQGGTVDGRVETTRVLYQGRVIDISQATPDRVYQGLYDGTTTLVRSAKWGVVERYILPLAPRGVRYEEGYLHGADAGAISIQAPGMALDGELLGKTVVGSRQIRESILSSALPMGGSLGLSFTAQNPANPGGLYFPTYSPTPPTVIFGDGSLSPVGGFELDASGNPSALSAERLGIVYLSPDLYSAGGFSLISVENSDGDVLIPRGTDLKLPVGGSLLVESANIRIGGRVEAPGGTLSFTAYNFSPYQAEVLLNTSGAANPGVQAGRGLFVLESGALVSAAGLLVDDRPSSRQGMFELPMQWDAGDITVAALQITLQPGSRMDVSGGLGFGATGERVYGDGGSISLLSGRDPNPDMSSLIGGGLSLLGELEGWSGNIGGSLTLQAPRVVVGGANPGGNVLWVDEEFFTRGGFHSFTLSGIGARDAAGNFLPAVDIRPGFVLNPVAWSRLARPFGAGGMPEYFTVLKPEGMRPAINLTFQGLGAQDSFNSGVVLARGEVRLGTGAVISTDAYGEVTFSGQTVLLAGSVFAPGGKITATGSAVFPQDAKTPAFERTTLLLASTAHLSTAGKLLELPDTLGYGRRLGVVVPGGTISLAGNIVARAGSRLDVSGAVGTLDVSPWVAGLLDQPKVDSSTALTRPTLLAQTVPVTLGSDGGTIRLTGRSFLFFDGELIGHAGNSKARGGRLYVSSGRFYEAGTARTSADINLVVTQGGASLPSGATGLGLGEVPRDSGGGLLQQMGYFSVNGAMRGGFSEVSLGGNVDFRGPVSLQVDGAIQVGTGGVIRADNRVLLSAPYVALGQTFRGPQNPEDSQPIFTQTDTAGTTTPYYFSPTTGTGRLDVRARLIEVGNLSLSNIGQATLEALRGDIRGDGTFQMSGSLLLRAGQIYPTTATSFSLIVYDTATESGSIRIERSGSVALPFSAGGVLNLYAGIIEQGGVLRAPLGIINLGWDGSGTAPLTSPLAGTTRVLPTTTSLTLLPGSMTSVSAYDAMLGRELILPYGLSEDGQTWIAPDGVDITGGGLPAKAINLGAVNIETQEGSVLDLRGGGDLLAYRWVEGAGGQEDLLASSGSFAIVPYYQAAFAPVGSFNTATGDAGYVNSSLRVGDRIYLQGTSELPAGYYTLLPARYALLPGAFLLTPQSGSTLGEGRLPDGAVYLSGYRLNDLTGTRSPQGNFRKFELAPQSVVFQRAQYEIYLANSFLAASAARLDLVRPRLPNDAGQILFQGTASMNLLGTVLATAGAAGGRGGIVDISSPVNIRIGSRTGAAAGELVLDPSQLSSFRAESLLIGGSRTFSTEGSTITVRTGNILVDNAGSSLFGSEILLAANTSLTLADGASIVQSGSGSTQAIQYTLPGDGVFLKVSANDGTSIVRTGQPSLVTPSLVIGADVLLAGKSLILDSTFATSLDASAVLRAESIALNSGQISLQLENPGVMLPTTGLVLGGGALESLQAARSLSLLSYTSLDIYGTGEIGSETLDRLTLRTGHVRGFNQGGGEVVFRAGEIRLENTANTAEVSVPGGLDGVLRFESDTLQMGANTLRISQFAEVRAEAAGGSLFTGEGALIADGGLVFVTPVLVGSSAADYSITADGELRLELPAVTAESQVTAGLGATLRLKGSNIEVGNTILLPSGLVSLRATTGDLNVDGEIVVAGRALKFYDQTRYSSAGEIHLQSDVGNINLGAGSLLDLSAMAGGGEAGLLSIAAPQGALNLLGRLDASAGSEEKTGKFKLDLGMLPGTAGLFETLRDASFFRSQDLRIRQGDVILDGWTRAREFVLAVDGGDLRVAGEVQASGETGGKITLMSGGSLTLESGAVLDVRGEQFDSAGKGGKVVLEAGVQRDGAWDAGAVLSLESGSGILLGVDAFVPGGVGTPGSSAFYGNFAGTLHLRAPRTAGNNEIQMAAIDASIEGASSILVEGWKLTDLTATGGVISTAVQNTIFSESQAWLGAAGSASAAYTAMMGRLLANNGHLEPITVLAPGVEIINRTGSLTLGTTSSTTTSDWNLSAFRFGPKSAAGVLTLRARDNLVFYNALSDGFTPTLASSNTSWLWLAPMSAYNPLLPMNLQSWSYRLTAGADLGAANFRTVRPLETLATGVGLLQLGKDAGSAAAVGSSNALTSSVIANRFQVIRTGSGNIDIHVGRDFQLLNVFSSIYTAGTQVPDATTLFEAGDFSVPGLTPTRGSLTQGNLGAAQQSYGAYYSMAGGDIVIQAGVNIERKTRDNTGLVDDSSRQLPNNWLYRRGYIGADGTYGRVRVNGGGLPNANYFEDPAASTSWWVDFSNFFQGVGALGGGHVTLVAGQDVKNVDAVIPTNARAAKGVPSSAKLVELGGGDLTVQAGRNLDAGVYYVERGTGRLSAGADIVTNATRSPSTGLVTSLNNPTYLNALTWMPTTLFLGKSHFDVRARGDILLGPMANPFLLPQGLNNRYWYKTYFSTYSQDAGVSVSSLGGDVTLRNAVTMPDNSSSQSFLYIWLERQNLQASGSLAASYYQPWLRLNETSIQPFQSLFTLLPPQLSIEALSGSVNTAGTFTLSPSVKGQVEIYSQGGVNAFQPTGWTTRLITGQNTRAWTSTWMNLSDANPASIPSVLSPLAVYASAGTSPAANNSTQAGFLSALDNLFAESGSVSGRYGIIQTKQALHAPGVLHANSADPLRIYAATGNISGLTLFSAKSARLLAGRDVSDVALYLQNTSESSISVVGAGRDIVPYNANSSLRSLANQSGNSPAFGETPLAGDIQISGPGSLQVLAGRNVDLGVGASRGDLGTGITSIGNARNPFLPFAGASIFLGAGLGPSAGLEDTLLDFPAFIDQFVRGGRGAAYLAELGSSPAAFELLDEAAQNELALQVFYLVLRDSGREEGMEGGYATGFEAIEVLFAKGAPVGQILTRSRDIRTKSGGSINIFAPGGGLTLAETIVGTPAAPPGVITESGGNISIFTDQSVSIGLARIFTLRGGNIIIWASQGDIAAGSAAKTVASAPPTRVLIDPQSAAVQTDLAGLATGGGIGVLATVEGVPPGDVDLIAPKGVVDAGDAGIRSAGNLRIAATAVLNAGNIAVGGVSGGVPSGAAAPSAAAPAVAPASTSPTAANNQAAESMASQSVAQAEESEAAPSVYTVEVLGYGGGEEEDEDRLSAGGSAEPSA